MQIRILIPRPRRTQSGWRTGRLTVAVMIIATGGTLYALLSNGGLVALMRARARTTQLHYQILASERENQAMLDQIRALSDDPQAIEKVAREELNMGLPDETIYLLPPTLSTEPGRSPQASEESPSWSPSAPSLPTRR